MCSRQKRRMTSSSFACCSTHGTFSRRPADVSGQDGEKQNERRLLCLMPECIYLVELLLVLPLLPSSYEEMQSSEGMREDDGKHGKTKRRLQAEGKKRGGGRRNKKQR